MIRHICMFKFKEENKKENIGIALDKVQALKALPQIKRFEVAVNMEEAPESNYEFTLIFDFESMDDLNSYQKDPKHLEFGNFIKAVREARACIDYEL